MPRSIWKGSIAFGLVQIPVDLHSAEEPDDLSFRQLDKHDFALAAKTFTEAQKRFPTDADVLCGLALAYQPSARGKMLELLKAALEQNAHHVPSLLGLVDHVHVLNRACLRIFEQTYPEIAATRALSVIHNGIDDESFVTHDAAFAAQRRITVPFIRDVIDGPAKG